MSTARTVVQQRSSRDNAGVVLRVAVALCLVVDAAVHLHLARGYQQSAPSGIGAGNLFRIQAVFALGVAVWLAWRGGRAAFLAAFAVGVSAVAAVVLYRYVNVPAIGPLPAMYEPVWFAEKTLSAVAEGVAAAGALLALSLTTGRSSAPRHGGPTRN